MRPADSFSVYEPGGASPGVGPVDPRVPVVPVESPPVLRVTLGVPVCAICHDAAAVPTLAGDRSRGPDYLYLVCDRCGSRWQCLRVDEVSLKADA